MKIDYKNKKFITEQEGSEEELQLKLEEATLQLQSDKLATKQSVAKAKRKLDEVKQSFPLNTQNILNAKKDLEEYERGYKELCELEEELGLSSDILK